MNPQEKPSSPPETDLTPERAEQLAAEFRPSWAPAAPSGDTASNGSTPPPRAATASSPPAADAAPAATTRSTGQAADATAAVAADTDALDELDMLAPVLVSSPPPARRASPRPARRTAGVGAARPTPLLPPANRRRPVWPWILAFGLLGSVAIGAVIALVGGNPERPETASSTLASAVPDSTRQAPATAPRPATLPTSAGPSETPAEEAVQEEVQLELRLQPADAQAKIAGATYARGRHWLFASDEAQTVVVSRHGYTEEQLSLVLDQNRVVEVTLEPLPSAPGPEAASKQQPAHARRGRRGTRRSARPEPAMTGLWDSMERATRATPGRTRPPTMERGAGFSASNPY